MAWTSPIQIALAVYFLWGILGPSSMAGNSKHLNKQDINKGMNIFSILTIMLYNVSKFSHINNVRLNDSCRFGGYGSDDSFKRSCC